MSDGNISRVPCWWHKQNRLFKESTSCRNPDIIFFIQPCTGRVGGAIGFLFLAATTSSMSDCFGVATCLRWVDFHLNAEIPRFPRPRIPYSGKYRVDSFARLRDS